MLSSQRITENINLYADVILKCKVYISNGIREGDNQNIPSYVCALLNSGGGLLQMQNGDVGPRVQSKDLDLWWSGMENVLKEVISGNDLCNYSDFVGNYDDQYFYVFVKSSENLCTLNFHCRLPTETATHDVSHRSVLKLLSNNQQPGSLTDLPSIPTTYRYLQTQTNLKQEGKQIQFKFLCSETRRSLPKRIGIALSRYITAFANHEGGHVYFGIEDQRAEVRGEDLTEEEEEVTVCNVTRKINSMIWGDSSFKVVKGVHWDIKFYPVQNLPLGMQCKIIVVSICKFPGGVFSACPESYRIDSAGKVRPFTYSEWKTAVLQELKDKPELHSRFIKVPVPSPCPKLIFTLANTIKTCRNKHLKLSTSSILHPKHILDNLQDNVLKSAIVDILSTFEAEEHLAIDINSWGFGLQKHAMILQSVFVLSFHYGLLLITFVKQGVYEFKTVQKECVKLGSQIKEKLVEFGGSCERLGISSHIVNINDDLFLQSFQSEISRKLFPATFSMNQVKLDNLLDSVFVTIASYKPHEADSKNEEYYFLLTTDQFELLWTHQFTKELWIHGAPASGKTVTILQMVKELSRRGCQPNQLLYIAENDLLCVYIRSFDICTVVTRRQLMADVLNPKLMISKYGQIQNVFVDEAQNFKDRDGDWYSVAEKLANQTNSLGNSVKSGYFWVSMDYAQKVHKFKAGLPALIGKHNFMLSEISRTSKEIFEYASKFMNTNNNSNQCIKDSPKLGHDFSSGQQVNVIHCDQAMLTETLSKILGNLGLNGKNTDEVAILTGKKRDANEIANDILPKIDTPDLTVDSVKRFSGLNRPTIIGLNPDINDNHGDINKFIVNLATRAQDNLVIITTNSDLVKKLQK